MAPPALLSSAQRWDDMRALQLQYLMRALISGCLLGLGACASIVEGTSQTININTNPTAASCTFQRDGRVLGVVSPTPGSIRVDKNSNDIRVDCKKPGYQDVNYYVKSEFAGATLGNLLLGGVVGVVVDAGTGANRKYESNVTLAMARPGEPQPPQSPVADQAPTGFRQPIPAAAPPAPTLAAPESLTSVPADPNPSLLEASTSETTSDQPRPLSDQAARRLSSLKDMLDRKALTPAEYERKRAAIVSGG